ncbi:toprim domain-containing protein [Candidatus Woesearchaeota archaeon]|nr:toprim domain-containing protein [Candidatus Woesearchaeota archaeon]
MILDARLVIEELSRLCESGIPVIVEGKSDREALEAFGISNIVTLDRPFFEIVESLAKSSSEVAILTDLDAQGKQYYHRLYIDLTRHGVKIDNRLRYLLLSETKVRQIEGLARWMERSA